MHYEGSQAATAIGAERHEYTSWKHPYNNTNICFRSELVNRLSKAALRAAKQGTEVGGLLWGKTGSGASVEVADATFVQNSAAQFNHTALDLRHLQQAVNGWAPQASLSLVGYFRSHLRDGLSLSAQDRAFLEQEIRDPESVFLVLKPFEMGLCTAGFFFWHNGRLETTDSELEVPFVAMEPATRTSGLDPQANKTSKDEGEESLVSVLRESATRRAPPTKAGHHTLKSAANTSDASLVTPSEPAKQPLGAVGIVAALSFLSILIAGIGLYFFIWPRLHSRTQPVLPKEPETGIHLQVEHGADGELALSWNRNSPEIRKATRATLVVLDGQVSRPLSLDREQLHSGKLIYFPKHPDVEFKLELNVDRLHTLAESIRAGLPEAARQRVAGREHTRPALPRGTRSAVPVPVNESNIGPSAQVTNPGPVLAGAEPSPSAATLPLVRPVLPARELVTGAPSPDPAVGGTYVPPRAIQEIMPETSPLGHFAQILVQVNIDEAGRVIAAHAAGGAAGVHDELTDIAVTAAKRWRFQPATLDGKPIPAEYTIVFAFHPSVPGAKQ
jgi:hypothetical protein